MIYDSKYRPQISFEWVFVTPEMASKWLAIRHPDQRAIRPHRVARYANDIANMRWTPSGETIAFDEDEWLVDGQTRLSALVRAGVAIWLPIAKNLPKKSIVNMGTGLVRGAVDCFKMSGVGNFTNRQAATARAMMSGFERIHENASNSYLLAFMETYADALAFVETHHNVKICGHTKMVRALTGRAFLHMKDRTRLIDWCSVIRTGMPVSSEVRDDTAAICYRDYLAKNAKSGGQDMEKERYAKGQSALSYFIARTPINKLQASWKDSWPLNRVVQGDTAD